MAQPWYYCHEGQRHGPMTEEQLRVRAAAGELGPADLVWTEGMPQWSPARAVPALNFATPRLPPPPMPGPLVPRPIPPQAVPPGTMATHCRHCGKGLAPRAVVCVGCGMRPHEGDRFCPCCAAPTQARQVVCLRCGAGLPGSAAAMTGTSADRIAPSDPPKDPLLMGVLSGCCIAGLGQIVLGQAIKGIVVLLISLVFGVITSGVSLVITWPAIGVDAYLIAKKLKEGKTVGPWEFF